MAHLRLEDSWRPHCKWSRVLAAFVLVLFASGLCAPRASAQVRFDIWTTDNGLPQNSINAILQTRDGYLFLATNGGLVRFDGVRFTVFNASNTAGLGDNVISCLCEDARGDLWLGTEEGLVRKRGASFTTYTTADGLPGNRVFAVQAAGDGRLLIGTGGGFVCRDNEEFKACNVRTWLPAASVRRLFVPLSETAWSYSG